MGGVDLIEDGKPLIHYDGIVNIKPAKIDGCQKEKIFIKDLAKKFNVSIYQLNPKADWLELKDIGLL